MVHRGFKVTSEYEAKRDQISSDRIGLRAITLTGGAGG